MVVGVEVAVVAAAGVARARGPHPVGDVEVAAERDDVRRPDGPGERRVAAQRGAVDEEAPHARRGVAVLHAGGVAAFGRPDARWAGRRGAARRRRGRSPARTRAPGAAAAGRTGGWPVRRAARRRRRRTSARRSGEAPWRQWVSKVGQRGRGGAVLVGGEVGQAGGGAVGAQQPAAEPGVHAAEAVRVVELGGEHGRDAEREQVAAALGGQPSHDVEHGQVGVRPRLVEPLLPDRPPPVVGEPGEVGVQDEAERPDGPAGGVGHRRTLPPHRVAVATRSRLASTGWPWASGQRMKSAVVTAVTSRRRRRRPGVGEHRRGLGGDQRAAVGGVQRAQPRAVVQAEHRDVDEPRLDQQLDQLGGRQLPRVERVERRVAAGGERRAGSASRAAARPPAAARGGTRAGTTPGPTGAR